MNKKTFFIIALFMILSSVFFYALNNHIIIIRSFLSKPLSSAPTTALSMKKNISLYLWQDEWKHETQSLLWSPYIAKNCKMLLQNWLHYAFEEKVVPHLLTIQTACLINNEQELLISFDRSPFEEMASTRKKWYCIESILKTIRLNGFSISSVRFLVDHQPMIDAHLDFSNPWPLEGFIPSLAHQ